MWQLEDCSVLCYEQQREEGERANDQCFPLFRVCFGIEGAVPASRWTFACHSFLFFLLFFQTVNDTGIIEH